MKKYSLITEDSIREWIADHEPDGASKLLQEVVLGRLIGARAAAVKAFLNRRNAEEASIAALSQANRDERITKATERAAKWAGWALVVSVAALALAGWPYIKPT